MFYYENLPMKEILEKTEYETEQVVRNKKYKCLKQLEQMLNENPLLKETIHDKLKIKKQSIGFTKMKEIINKITDIFCASKLY